MLDTPNCWLLRSFASLLLPLISSDLDLVLRYFHILYNSDRTNVASLLISLIMTVSPYFIATASQVSHVQSFDPFANVIHDLFDE